MADQDCTEHCKLCRGPMVFLFGCVCLVYGEFRYVWQQNTIQFAEANAIHVGCDCSPKNDGKLVFANCNVTHMPKISDAPGLDGVRPLFQSEGARGTDVLMEVRILQWKKNGKGADKVWVDHPLKNWTLEGMDAVVEDVTGGVKKAGGGSVVGHDNHGRMPANVESIHIKANNGSVWLGNGPVKNDFFLKSNDLVQILKVSDSPFLIQGHMAKRAFVIGDDTEISSDTVFTKNNTIQTWNPDTEPRIGDIRIELELVQPKSVGIIAKQTERKAQPLQLEVTHKQYEHGTGDDQESQKQDDETSNNTQLYPEDVAKEHPPCTFEPYLHSDGLTIDWLYDGQWPHISDFTRNLQDENSAMLWCYRLGGFMIVSMGIFLFTSGGSEKAEDGQPVMALALGAIFSAIIIAVTLLYLHPLLLVPVAVICGFCWLGLEKWNGSQSSAAQQKPCQEPLVHQKR